MVCRIGLAPAGSEILCEISRFAHSMTPLKALAHLGSSGWAAHQ
jgi:hypothetical protein